MHTLSVAPSATWSTRHAGSKSFSQWDPTPNRQVDMAGANQAEVGGGQSCHATRSTRLAGTTSFESTPGCHLSGAARPTRLAYGAQISTRASPGTVISCPTLPWWRIKCRWLNREVLRLQNSQKGDLEEPRSRSGVGSSYCQCGGPGALTSGLFGHQYSPQPPIVGYDRC
jgi:hypothetical protein